MRKLNLKDMFSASRLVIKLSLKEDILEITEKLEQYKTANSLGYELLYRAFEKATTPEAENAIYEFLSGPFEKTALEVSEMPLDEMLKDMKGVINIGEILTFFKTAAS